MTSPLILIICYAPEFAPLSSLISSATGLPLLPAQLSKQKEYITQTQHPFFYLIARLFRLYPEIGQPSLAWLHCTSCPLCFFHPIVPGSFGFAVLFCVQTRTQVCPLLKSLLPSSTELIRSRFQSYISVQTTQVLQNWHSADITAALPWLKTDLLSHLVWKIYCCDSWLFLTYSFQRLSCQKT